MTLAKHLLVIVLILPCYSLAVTDMALTLGAQTTDVSTNESGVTANSGTGFSSGIIGFVELADPTYLRVGAILTERRFEVEVSNVDNELESLYLEAPINYLHMVNDNVGWFAGGRVGLKIRDEDCTLNGQACPGSDLGTIIYGIEAGGHFLLSPEFGVEASYVYGLSEIADNVDFDGSLLINGFFIF